MYLSDEIWELIVAHHGPLRFFRDGERIARVAATRLQRRWKSTYTPPLCVGDRVVLLSLRVSAMRLGIVRRQEDRTIEVHVRTGHVFFVDARRDHRFRVQRKKKNEMDLLGFGNDRIGRAQSHHLHRMVSGLL